MENVGVARDDESAMSVDDEINDAVFEQLAGFVDGNRVEKFGALDRAPQPGVVLELDDDTNTRPNEDEKPIVFKYGGGSSTVMSAPAAPAVALGTAVAGMAQKKPSHVVKSIMSMTSQKNMEYFEGEQDSDFDEDDARELANQLEARGEAARAQAEESGHDDDGLTRSLARRFSVLSTLSASSSSRGGGSASGSKKKSMSMGKNKTTDNQSGSGKGLPLLKKTFSKKNSSAAPADMADTSSAVSDDSFGAKSEYGTTEAADEVLEQEDLLVRQALLLPDGFSRDEATLMVEFTSAAYCRVHNSTFFECGCGTPARGFEFTGRYVCAKTDSSGFVGRQARRHYICAGFRGTVSMKNWVYNVKAAMIDANKQKSEVGAYYKSLPNDVKLHLGFYRSFEAIGGGMLKEVLRLHKEFPSDQIYVCGHSLGGAMATHLALALVFAGVPADVMKCYTFGQPRVGNDAFQREFDARIKHMFRIVNNYDIVPHLPQYSTGFRHVGQELWFSSRLSLAQRKALLIKNQYTETDRVEISGLMDACANTIPFGKLGIVDHLLYYDRITGTHRLRGAAPPKVKVKPDGRVEAVSDSFWMDVFDPNANVLIWEYSLKSAKSAKNKAPFQQLIEYAKKLALEEGVFWNLKVVQINTAVNDLPKQYAPIKGQDTTVYFKPPSSWPPPPPVLLNGPITFESLKAMVETYWGEPRVWDRMSCVTQA